MKNIGLKTLALPAIIAFMLPALSSCDAMMIGATVDSGPAPGSYYYNWADYGLPPLASVPVTSPFYYGGPSFPIGGPRPVVRPGQGPMGNPVNPVPSPAPNIPGGNIRPGQVNRPVTLPEHPVNIGSNPGLQAPPAESGLNLRPGNGR